MLIATLELVGCVLMLVAYLKLVPARLRAVNNPNSLVFNFLFASIAITIFLFLAVGVNHYSLSRIGVNPLTNFWPALGWTTVVMVMGIGVMYLILRSQGNKVRWHGNMPKLAAPYLFWGYAQQLLVLGFETNFVVDAINAALEAILNTTVNGIPAIAVATIANGILFGSIHGGNRTFAILTGTLGCFLALIFLIYPNLIPIALAHSTLATLYYYWIKGEDKWVEIFRSKVHSR